MVLLMSLAESPVHSSSIDDFAGLLERELQSGSLESSTGDEDEEDKEADGDDDGSDVETESRIKRRKGDNLESVEETNGSISQGRPEQKSEASATEDMLIEQSGVTFGYIHRGLRLNNDEIDRLCNTDIKKSLNNKKLYLVLDLDHTLLNSTQLNHMTAEEEYLMRPPDSLPDIAWIRHKDNLILTERYHFFRSSCAQFGFTGESLSELKSDESEPEGALANVLDLLKRIHKFFFYELGGNLIDRDVRQEVLKGCKVVFSRIIPSKVQADTYHHLWKMAEQLGAICSTEVDSSVTHVVALCGESNLKTKFPVTEMKSNTPKASDLLFFGYD
ncbi:putative protein-serine/threonine phosphatase [Rosa chinensis]|uniref:protein-serine/threonine phosphatase n=1 Tax=Rosa chinensis TaxID=74649 RepID=A0A2P6PGH1_ROSCH|nr:putative protein-serine/threonine phosphatase [Rosa chinensis]